MDLKPYYIDIESYVLGEKPNLVAHIWYWNMKKETQLNQNVSQSGSDAAPSSGCYCKILAIHQAILSYKWYLALYFKKCSLVKVLSFYL